MSFFLYCHSTSGNTIRLSQQYESQNLTLTLTHSIKRALHYNNNILFFYFKVQRNSHQQLTSKCYIKWISITTRISAQGTNIILNISHHFDTPSNQTSRAGIYKYILALIAIFHSAHGVCISV
jgi:hypothetical protein